MDFALPLAHRMRRLTAFAVLGWAMLLVVVLSAAPSGAEPRMRLIGSAFDPSSVSVALNRRPANPVKARLIQAAGDKGQAGDAPGAPPMLAVAHGAAPVRPQIHPRAAAISYPAPVPPATLLASPSGLPHGPRAPPAG